MEEELLIISNFFLNVFKMPKWWFNKVDKFRTSFLWTGQDPENVKRGHYLVNW
jgi:hypothetical protein